MQYSALASKTAVIKVYLEYDKEDCQTQKCSRQKFLSALLHARKTHLIKIRKYSALIMSFVNCNLLHHWIQQKLWRLRRGIVTGKEK